MKMTGVMTFVSILVFVLPAHVAGGGLRGLLLEPLQMPPPATADLALAQLHFQGPAPAASPAGAPGGSPGPAPGPAPNALPEEPKIPKITSATCAALTGKVGGLVGAAGGAPGPAPAPAAAMLQGSAPSPAGAGGDKPTVECKIYAYVSGKPTGCSCFVETPPPPFKAKVAGCPEVPGALEMGITGPVQSLGPMSFGGQTGGWTRHTCMYRQWILDPTATGLVADYQTRLNDARAKKYIQDTYAASLNNAKNSAAGFWALTPVPWLKLYPTTPMPVAAAAPGPAPGAAMFSTTPPILFATPPTTPSPFGMMTTPRPFGAMPFGTPGPFGTTARPFGMPTTPAAGFTTAPTYAVVR